jgi:hypothetical protein
MKIREPRRRPPPPLWWVGAELTCRRCGCEVTLEESDASGIDRQKPDRGGWPCPTCGEWMFLAWHERP